MGPRRLRYVVLPAPCCSAVCCAMLVLMLKVKECMENILHICQQLISGTKYCGIVLQWLYPVNMPNIFTCSEILDISFECRVHRWQQPKKGDLEEQKWLRCRSLLLCWQWLLFTMHLYLQMLKGAMNRGYNILVCGNHRNILQKPFAHMLDHWDQNIHLVDPLPPTNVTSLRLMSDLPPQFLK